jgi:hypothetical protein
LGNLIFLFGIFAQALFVSGALAEESSTTVYQVKQKESVSEILFRLGIVPVYGKKGALAIVLELNPKIRPQHGDRVYPGDELVLPSMPGAPAVSQADPEPKKIIRPLPEVSVVPPESPAVTPTVPVELEEKPRSIAYDLGVGFSYLDYKENIASSNFRLTEYGVTMKGGFGYKFSPKIEMGGSLFVTALPLKKASDPAALSSARFYGANGRIGYLLSDFGPNAKLYVFTGWYAWGMSTPSAPTELSYGITYLGGPQLLLSGRFKTDAGRRFSTYAKFATIQDSAGISFSNREIAIGGSYEVGRLSSEGERHRTWMLALDIANAQYSISMHSFELKSYTLGLSTSFH